MPTPHAVPSPEEYAAGLHHDPANGTLAFVMPQVGEQTVSIGVGTVVDSLVRILDARDKLPKAEATLKFISSVAGRKMLGAVIDISVAQLFDTALADTLKVVGDVNLGAAIDKLQDAANEPSDSGKKRHRMLAEGHLGVVYRAAVDAAQSLEASWLGGAGMRTKRTMHEYRRATLCAATIALINHDAGTQGAAVTWADTTRETFSKYADYASKLEVEAGDVPKPAGSNIYNPKPGQSFLEHAEQAINALVEGRKGEHSVKQSAHEAHERLTGLEKWWQGMGQWESPASQLQEATWLLEKALAHQAALAALRLESGRVDTLHHMLTAS